MQILQRVCRVTQSPAWLHFVAMYKYIEREKLQTYVQNRTESHSPEFVRVYAKSITNEIFV